ASRARCAKAIGFFRILGHMGHPVYVVGGPNWRPMHNSLANHWARSAVLPGLDPTTASMGATPTRALHRGSGKTPVHAAAAPLPGVPLHGHVSYMVDVPFSSCSAASYVTLRSCSGAEKQVLQELVDQDGGPPLLRQFGDDDVSLAGRWAYWHGRAGRALMVATEQGGVAPATALSVLRFQRIARAAAGDVLALHAVGRPTCGDALDWISRAIAAGQQRQHKQASKAWRQRFASWSNAVWATATPVCRSSQPAAAMAVEDMRKRWHAQWRPENYASDTNLHN
ncbi:unnamed protein product, partial [Prorocentrum cordatum]